MLQRWRTVDNTVPDLTGPRFELQTSRFGDERVTARPTGRLVKRMILWIQKWSKLLLLILVSYIFFCAAFKFYTVTFRISHFQAAWLKDWKSPSLSLGRGNLANKKRCNYIIINVFRNDFECSYEFAIALPFSIRSLTYTNGYFYAIRDDGDPGASTLFRISETDLIGGYVYWHQMAQKQCESCLPSDRPISFDLGNYEETCTM